MTRAPARGAQRVALAVRRLPTPVGAWPSLTTTWTQLYPAHQQALRLLQPGHPQGQRSGHLRLLQLGLILLSPRFHRSELLFEFFDLLAKFHAFPLYDPKTWID